MDYQLLTPLNEDSKSKLTSVFQVMLSKLRQLSFEKAVTYLRYIPEQCFMHYLSSENRKLRDSHPKRFHPITPQRGDIYNAYITEGIGSELCGNHLVIIIQNKKANIYSEKVNVLPIEGNGLKINPNYQIRLTSNDLSSGTLDKDPSRIIITDIITIDKARLGKKIGRLSQECLASVDTSLKRQLELY